MILVIIHMKVSEEKRKELTQTIVSLVSIVRSENGCRRCDFFCGIDDENTLCLFEEWDTIKNFEIHRHSDCFKVLRGGMNLLEKTCEIITYRSLHKAEILEIGQLVEGEII